MSTLADIRPGQVLGRYEFLAPIAQGGMASVWAARQWGSRGFRKVVAIKTMLPAISDDPRFERMFLDEARIASKIRHNHVVEILDLGEQNAVLYLVMEWVDGESLSVIRRAAAEYGGVPVTVALRIIVDVCSGLHAAHELCDDDGQPFGLVHRDVSPQNILVGYDGVAKVLDFGVAKVAGRASETTNIGHTRGKPPYMAPEQALGHIVDRRADIFSLGIVLYQLIAGRHPFRGENDIATLHNIISDQVIVSPKAFVSNLSEGIERVMLRALERDPARRFQSAREMELSLEALLDAEVGRIRTEELGQLITKWLGTRGEGRRQALREAIRRVDGVENTHTDVASLDASFLRTATTALSRDGVEDLDRRVLSSDRDGAGIRSYSVSNPIGGVVPIPIPIRSNGTIEGVETSSSSVKENVLEASERTVAELPPNWLIAASAVDWGAAPSVLGNRRISGLRRIGLIVFVAMCIGALLTWVGFTIRSRVKLGVSLVPSAASLVTSTSVTIASTSTVAIVGGTRTDATESASVPTGTNVHTVIAEPRSIRGVRPNSAQGKKRPSGPTYKLPPVPSPGF